MCYLHIKYSNGDVEKYILFDKYLVNFHEYYNHGNKQIRLKYKNEDVCESYNDKWEFMKRYNYYYEEYISDGRLISVCRNAVHDEMITYNENGLISSFRKYPYIISYYQPSCKIASYFTYNISTPGIFVLSWR